MNPPLPKVFMSYARADSAAALRLAKELKAAGTDAWLDQLDITPGERWDLEVEKGLGQSDCVLVLLTPASVASNNVMDEVSYALDEGKEILPVIIEKCKIPLRLRRLQFVDFTRDYDSSLKTLVAALGAVARGEKPSANVGGWERLGNLSPASAQPLRPLYIGSAAFGGLLMFMFYLVFFDSLSETMLIKLSYAWVPVLVFGVAGLTFTRGSLKKSAAAAGIALFVLFIFLQGVFPSL